MPIKTLGLGLLLAGLGALPAARAASAPVAAAETTISIDAAFTHTQYHENALPGSGDDESGYTPGFGVGLGALLPIPGSRYNPDLYTALAYDFSAGNIHYGGHYLVGGQPLSASDRAVFNRLEARIGLGFPLVGGAEAIPFFAAGYQSWNRNIDVKGAIGTDEFYHSALVGGGAKLDVPLTRSIVASATAELLGMVGGGIRTDGLVGDFGPSAEERVELGLDYDVAGPFHAFGTVYWEHFNYAGTKATADSLYYEPLSTTTQFGAAIGVGYSFN